MHQFYSIKRVRRGFSLIELLVVISIIVILAGIGLTAFSSVKKNQAIKLTQVRIKNASLKLQEYANENNGLYPVGEDASSSILYNTLSGDYSGQGKDPTGPVFWKELLNKDPSLVGTLQGKKVILDAFGQSLRYRAARDESGEIVPDVKNDGSFDIWSIGPDGEPSDLNTDGNADTEQTQDDIW
ncbi:MAG: prepilin-type N-terminal cleavage/methylation domain-containing protein [Akkermansiaceae bacterium]|jgi:prepilin-type N-terminal cleavage/methylation domain-containing protein